MQVGQEMAYMKDKIKKEKTRLHFKAFVLAIIIRLA